MTIGAPNDGKSDFEVSNRPMCLFFLRKFWQKLKECRCSIATALNIDVESLQLSMGMSSDFVAAIESGSTSVRVGSSIFGTRNYTT